MNGLKSEQHQKWLHQLHWADVQCLYSTQKRIKHSRVFDSLTCGPTVESTAQVRKFPVFLSFTNRQKQRSTWSQSSSPLETRGVLLQQFHVSVSTKSPDFSDEEHSNMTTPAGFRLTAAETKGTNTQGKNIIISRTLD